MPITFIHAADIHLGMENYGKIDPLSGLPQRLQDCLAGLAKLAETAFAEEADFVVFSGDIYKNSNPTPTTQRELARVLKSFSERQLPVIIILGNHDQANAFGKAHALSVFSVLDLPHVYVVDTPQLIKLPGKNGTVQLTAVPWPQRAQYFQPEEYLALASDEFLEELARRTAAKIKELLASADPTLPIMFFGHLMLKGAIFSGTEKMFTLGREPVIDKAALNDPRFAYVGLGHIHKFQELNHGAKPPIVYAGSLSRIDFQEKDEAKGFILGQLAKGEVALRFWEIVDRPFLEIEIKIADETNPTAAFIDQLTQYDLKNAIVKITYSASEKTAQQLDWRQIHQHLQECHYLVSVIPLQLAPNKTPRLKINETFSVERAFAEYVAINPDLAAEADKLNSLLKNLLLEAETL